MKKNLIFSFLLIFISCSLWAQNQYRKPIKPTKNVILMIPDGTSIGVYSAARWYQKFNKQGGDQLAVDPYLCGTVVTYSSNAPIGDSAPTTSCYMTGYVQQAGNVSIYPKIDSIHDIHDDLDPTRAYQPLATVLEAAKLDLNKSTGLVVTVEFCHATPADCSAHHYNRGKYKYIAPQQAANVDVVFGGGNKFFTEEMRTYLTSKGTRILQNDVEAFKQYNGDQNIWAMFGETAFPYDMDRDPAKIPSLAEMTEKAIDRLSKDENGFFLMVEGSQVDWAAHSNDAVSIITEYLAFDKAVKVAMDFAEKNGETTVVMLSDHGNSGFTIGKRDFKNYSKRGLNDVMGAISNYKMSARKLEEVLLKAKPDDFKGIIKEQLGLDITDEELETLLKSKNYKEGDYMQVSNSVNLASSLVKIMNTPTAFGFTTGGHTGEEVLLAAYHPNGDIPNGMNTNIEINKYLCDVVGLQRPLDDLTNEIFAKHTDVFEGLKYKIDMEGEFPILTVKKGKKELKLQAFTSQATLNGEVFDLGSATVYIDKNETFYLPKFLRKKLEAK